MPYEGENYDKPRNPRRFSRGPLGSLNDGVNTQRLRDSMEWSSQRLRAFRNFHTGAIKYFAGNRYGENNALDKIPINMLRLAVEIWLRQLIAKTPRCLVLTRNPALKVDSYELEIALDHLLQEINFGHNLAEAVRSAIFSLGVMKVGITDKYLGEGTSFLSDAGQPYAEPILFEDWLHDMNARRQEEWDWCANKYRIPYEMVMENPRYNSSIKNKLVATDYTSDHEGLGEGHYKSSELSSGQGITKTEYIRHIELWDVWIPLDNVFLTLPVQGGLEPLEIREWDGPESGPFHLLAFSPVPGNIVPAAPAQGLYDLQSLLTDLFNQLARQARRQKTLTIADGRAEADGTGTRIMESSDGAVIRASHIDSVKEWKTEGVDPGNLQFVMWLREIISYAGGNLDSMGGLSQQGETLGQERLLAQSSSEMLREMQSKVVSFSKEVITDLAWYLHTDPLIELPLIKRMPGFPDIPFTYGPNNRKSDFFAYNFDVNPYSLQDQGPQQRMQGLMQLAMNVLIPLAPQMEQWGQQLNLPHFIEMISKYGDWPEVEDLVTSSQPTMQQQAAQEARGKAPQRTLQSPNTTRNYVRENRSTGGTQQARDAGVMQSLVSAAAANKGRT